MNNLQFETKKTKMDLFIHNPENFAKEKKEKKLELRGTTLAVSKISKSDMKGLTGLYDELMVNEPGMETDQNLLTKSFDKIKNNPEYAILGFKKDGELIASVIGHKIYGVDGFSAPTLFIENVIVSEKSRGLGLGKALMTEIEGFGKKNACENAVLFSSAYRDWSHKFYQKEGYKTSSFVPFVKNYDDNKNIELIKNPKEKASLATIGDIPQIVNVISNEKLGSPSYEDTKKNFIANIFLNRDYQVFVAKKGGKVLGASISHIFQDLPIKAQPLMVVDNISIKKENYNENSYNEIGKSLLYEIEKKAKSVDSEGIKIFMKSNDFENINLLKKSGYDGTEKIAFCKKI